MASALFDAGRQRFLEGAIAWLTDNIKCLLIDTANYTVDLATDEFLVDIPSLGIVSTSANLTGKTSAGGVADANDFNFIAVTGADAAAMVLYKDTGSAATSPLIAYIDSGTGLPYTPTGADILVSWDNGSNKIFKI